jgi:hypothetical protein
MTAALASDDPAKVLTYLNNIPAAELGQFGHQAATSTCRVSMVKAMPRSARTSKHSPIASLILLTASAFVAPWLKQPGMGVFRHPHAVFATIDRHQEFQDGSPKCYLKVRVIAFNKIFSLTPLIQ